MLQLSRDEQPCVYHEFHLCVLTKAKQGHDVMVDVPVKVIFKFWILKTSALKDLSLAELQGLKSHHPSEKVAGVKVSLTGICVLQIMVAPQQTFGADDGKVEHDSFPSLESVLTFLDASCGFNIEVPNPTYIEVLK